MSCSKSTKHFVLKFSDPFQIILWLSIYVFFDAETTTTFWLGPRSTGLDPITWFVTFALVLSASPPWLCCFYSFLARPSVHLSPSSPRSRSSPNPAQVELLLSFFGPRNRNSLLLGSLFAISIDTTSFVLSLRHSFCFSHTDSADCLGSLASTHSTLLTWLSLERPTRNDPVGLAHFGPHPLDPSERPLFIRPSRISLPGSAHFRSASSVRPTRPLPRPSPQWNPLSSQPRSLPKPSSEHHEDLGSAPTDKPPRSA